MTELKWFRLKEGERLEDWKLYAFGGGNEKPKFDYVGKCKGAPGCWYAGPIELDISDPDPELLQCVGCVKPEVSDNGRGFVCYTLHSGGGFIVSVESEDRNVAVAAHNAAVKVLNDAVVRVTDIDGNQRSEQDG